MDTQQLLAHVHGTPLGRLGKIGLGVGALAIAYLIYWSLTHEAEHHEPHAPPLWGLGIVPFVLILGAIAILPLVHGVEIWWESNRNRLIVSLAVSALTLLYYILIAHADFEGVMLVLDHAIVGEYIPFIVLLFALYVISGGISITGDLEARPMTNTVILGFGALIASFIGTTGASMLLIRPLLNTNSERKHVVHTVIFFIFLVSNIGGCLLPIGDPPLFLGYLRGVPFIWTLGLWPQWAACSGLLLVIYFIWDTKMWRKEAPRDIQRDATATRPVRVRGWINLLCLLGVVLSVAFLVPGREIGAFTVFPFMRELMMLVFVALSLWLTPGGVREANHFNYTAIIEVAVVFLGIFVAMQVPITVLEAMGPYLTENFINEPWHFFWATGGLSSFLDNAPTYVVFFELGKTMSLPEGAAAVELAGGAKGVIGTTFLAAISLGAVFMGSMTYIGNGPNFMVKAIAEQSGLEMPSFFGYMFKYSIPILIPVFLIIMLIS